MTQRHILIMALVAGTVLGFFSLGLHECALSAGEAEMRVACRSICALSAQESAGDDVLRELTLGFQGVACSAMSDEAPQLLRCRDALRTREMSVADYHCLRDAEDLAEARDCDVL